MSVRRALTGGALAALVAAALSGCAPLGGEGDRTAPAARGAAAARGDTGPAVEAPAALPPSREPVAGQAGEQDLTERLVGRRVPRMGRVVTDEDGWILYRFDRDTNNPPGSTCDEECARVWPPAYTDGNAVVSGIDEESVGTVTRDDGTRQLTLNGWPVYRYAGDRRPGQWKGQAVGGVWFVIGPDGGPNKTCLPKRPPKPVAPPPENTGGGGY